MIPLTRMQERFQNIVVGPHLPVAGAPPVSTMFWTVESWANHYGVTVETYKQVCAIEAHRAEARFRNED